MVLVWKPITDLPQGWPSLTDGELKPLLQFWNDQRTELHQSGVLENFIQRLSREWSIETGQIEGVYDIDRGITETLIERGIHADLIPTQPGQKRPELIAAIIQDHVDVLEGLFQLVKGDRPLSKSYIHELHVALLQHQETTLVMDQFGNLFDAQLLKGRYKERPNNPKRPSGNIHQYCPPNQVDPEMERLLGWHEDHIREQIPVEIEAAWLHHRFTQIHPYQDGNGRVARALASLLFIKAGWFPVLVTRDDRSRYIDALEVADEGDLRSLVAFFADAQKRALFQATQAVADVQQAHTIEEAISAARRVLTGPGRSLDPAIWLTAKHTADRLIKLAEERLDYMATSLTEQIGKSRPEFQFSMAATSLTFVGNMVPYTPNKIDYDRNPALFIKRVRTAWIAVDAHAIGSKFRGLIGMAVVFQSEHGGSQLASKDVFQVNYAEAYENAERRFRVWLEQSLVNALTLWRKGL